MCERVTLTPLDPEESFLLISLVPYTHILPGNLPGIGAEPGP